MVVGGCADGERRRRQCFCFRPRRPQNLHSCSASICPQMEVESYCKNLSATHSRSIRLQNQQLHAHHRHRLLRHHRASRQRKMRAIKDDNGMVQQVGRLPWLCDEWRPMDASTKIKKCKVEHLGLQLSTLLFRTRYGATQISMHPHSSTQKHRPAAERRPPCGT